jgi:hypothetical protein
MFDGASEFNASEISTATNVEDMLSGTKRTFVVLVDFIVTGLQEGGGGLEFVIRRTQ